MAELEPLWWFSFTARGEQWHVYLSGDLKEREDAVGITMYHHNVIGVDVRQTPAELAKTLLHEMFHAHLPDVDTLALSEVFAPKVEAMWPTLRRFGLRVPKLPKGYAQLRREACKKRKKNALE